MSIRHVVTGGFGFADGVSFIPTLGFTPGEAVVLQSGPLLFTAGKVFVPGSAAGQVFTPGARRAAVFVPGSAAGKVECDREA